MQIAGYHRITSNGSQATNRPIKKDDLIDRYKKLK